MSASGGRYSAIAADGSAAADAARPSVWALLGSAAVVAFGIDIGGSGIKGAPVDTDAGRLAGDRQRVATPQPATPEAVADAVHEIVRRCEWDGPVGCTIPGVVKHGVVKSAANIDHKWIDTDAASLFADRLGHPVTIGNDADLAGLAEMRFGAGRGERGVVQMVTLGTGIGSALFSDGVLVPNTELGHIEMRGKDAEELASARARDEDGLSWGEWAHRVQSYLRRLENLVWPDLIIIGGGVSKRSGKFLPLVNIRTPVVPAQLLNEAGMIGAALTVPTEG
jgi:polyphosphate glucokinase